MQVDFGRSAADYARYRTGFPELLFDEAPAQVLAQDFPPDPLDIPHRLWAVLAVRP